jgi:hypothetical protein
MLSEQTGLMRDIEHRQLKANRLNLKAKVFSAQGSELKDFENPLYIWPMSQYIG